MDAEVIADLDGMNFKVLYVVTLDSKHCVCVCVYTNTYIYVHIYLHIYTHIHTYVYLHTVEILE
jgi:hypothetical protein